MRDTFEVASISTFPLLTITQHSLRNKPSLKSIRKCNKNDIREDGGWPLDNFDCRPDPLWGKAKVWAVHLQVNNHTLSKAIIITSTIYQGIRQNFQHYSSHFWLYGLGKYSLMINVLLWDMFFLYLINLVGSHNKPLHHYSEHLSSIYMRTDMVEYILTQTTWTQKVVFKANIGD